MALKSELWEAFLEGEPEGFEPVWEVFHENSKTGHLEAGIAPAAVAGRMTEMWDSLPYRQCPVVELPEVTDLPAAGVGATIRARSSARGLAPGPIELGRMATLLELAYGVTRPVEAGVFPRPFRASPSAGALYPLELYVHSSQIEGQRPGIYHYSPAERRLRLIVDGDQSRRLGQCLVQPALAHEASMLVFVTAMFERATFKYGDRGYRFALLEAGHVVQNLSLVATALGMSVIEIGGYFDRDIDGLLSLDGLTHSTVCVVAIGTRIDEKPAAVP
jgi:SagB-type dehydrogenase family enzyme